MDHDDFLVCEVHGLQILAQATNDWHRGSSHSSYHLGTGALFAVTMHFFKDAEPLPTFLFTYITHWGLEPRWISTEYGKAMHDVLGHLGWHQEVGHLIDKASSTKKDRTRDTALCL